MLTFATSPLSFQASNLNSPPGSATLSWSPPAGSSSTITNYSITVTYTMASGGMQTETVLVPGTSNQHTLTGLPTGTTFNVTLEALDSLGDISSPSLLSFSL
jgi:hypothetical protein